MSFKYIIYIHATDDQEKVMEYEGKAEDWSETERVSQVFLPTPALWNTLGKYTTMVDVLRRCYSFAGIVVDEIHVMGKGSDYSSAGFAGISYLTGRLREDNLMILAPSVVHEWSRDLCRDLYGVAITDSVMAKVLEKK